MKLELIPLGRSKVPYTLRICGVDSITPSVLAEVAEMCERLHEQLEDGSEDKIRMHCFAKDAAALVKNNDCPESGVAGIGPFIAESVHVPKIGDTVRVKKGAHVSSMHPKTPAGGRIQGRAQSIQVHSLNNGYVDQEYRFKNRIQAPEITWAGTGGYWNRVAIWDIEPAS